MSQVEIFFVSFWVTVLVFTVAVLWAADHGALDGWLKRGDDG